MHCNQLWYTCYFDLSISNSFIVTGFIFLTSVSLDPSTPRLNGWFLQCSTMYQWQWGPIALLLIAAVFVALQAYDWAILLSGKIVLKSGPRWHAVAIGKLCCIKKFVTTTSAFMTSVDVKLAAAKNCACFRLCSNHFVRFSFTMDFNIF